MKIEKQERVYIKQEIFILFKQKCLKTRSNYICNEQIDN